MITTSSSNYENVPDWEQALAWMRDNLPADATVGSWWDYGYWINVMANKTVISDNSTDNSTQIALIAEAFLGNETNAMSIFGAMNVSYVVVYEPFIPVTVGNTTVPIDPWSTSEGDFEKSTAMLEIAASYTGNNQLYNGTNYISSTITTPSGEQINWPLPAGPDAHDTLLYQLLFSPYANIYSSVFGISFDTLNHFQLVFQSQDGWVDVYKINY
jgi:asparagine N-glycosylation enzyme membrane subunit Stt3